MNTPNDAVTAEKVPSNFSILSEIFTSPGKAYENMKLDYPILFPFLTIVILNMLLVITLYSVIDYQWFIDHMVEMQAGELSKSEQDQTRQAFEMMNAGVMGGIGAVSVVIMFGVIFCLQALYFVIVSNITNDGFQFKQWFSLVSWSSMPSLLGVLAAFVVVLTASNGQVAPESMNPLTLNELFFGMNPTQGLGAIYATTDITMFWSMALTVIGYAKWTGKDVVKSSLIVLLPYLVYYGVRIAIAL